MRHQNASGRASRKKFLSAIRCNFVGWLHHRKCTVKNIYILKEFIHKLSEGYVMHYILLTRENFLAKPFKDIICVFFQCSSYRNNKASAINLKAAFCWACSLCSEVAPTLHAACCMQLGLGAAFSLGLRPFATFQDLAHLLHIITECFSIFFRYFWHA